jgi:hypothetical protein
MKEEKKEKKVEYASVIMTNYLDVNDACINSACTFIGTNLIARNYSLF